jgi:hypothetical protein
MLYCLGNDDNKNNLHVFGAEFFLTVLGIELRALSLLSKYSTT